MAFRVRIEDTEFNMHEFMVNDTDSIQASLNCDGRFKPIEPDIPDLEMVKETIKYEGWTADDLGLILDEKDIDDFDMDTIYEYIMDRDHRRRKFINKMEDDGYIPTKEA
jgi:hypothetical protein